jgi:hypothetical protein
MIEKSYMRSKEPNSMQFKCFQVMQEYTIICLPYMEGTPFMSNGL